MKVVSENNISRNRGADTVYGFSSGLTFHLPTSHQTTSEASSLSFPTGDIRIHSLSQTL